MKLLPLAAGLVVLGAAAPAVAQSTRSFPDAKCSYTLPATGWSWLAPNALPFPGGPTLALARSTGGLVVGLQVTDIGDDRRFFARVEADLAGGSVKAVDRRRVTFLGVSGYEVDFEAAPGSRGTLRAVAADGRLYRLRVMHGPGPAPDKADVEAAFDRFAFTGRVAGADEERDGAAGGKGLGLGRKLGGTLDTLGTFGLVALILFGAWAVIRMRG